MPCCAAGDLHLVMPSLFVEDVELAARDDDLVQDLEHSVSEWSLVLGEVMQRESEKHPSGTGPLAGALAAWLCFAALCSTLAAS